LLLLSAPWRDTAGLNLFQGSSAARQFFHERFYGSGPELQEFLMVVSLITLSHDLTKGSAEALELIGTARVRLDLVIRAFRRPRERSETALRQLVFALISFAASCFRTGHSG